MRDISSSCRQSCSAINAFIRSSDAEALAAAKREVGKAAERYCAVCESEEEMRAKVRPDMVVEGRRGREKCDMAGLLEGKSFGTNPTRYGSGWGRLGLTAAERRAREEVRDRWKAVDGIDDHFQQCVGRR